MKNLFNRDEKGFTLIEIVIVIAIAAALILIVLLAVGGAQRSRRDTTRANNVGGLAAAAEQYASNNNGKYPALQADLDTVTTTGGTVKPQFADPLTGTKPDVPVPASLPKVASPAIPVEYNPGYVCAPTLSAAPVVGVTRNYAISYWSETANGATCKDNS